MTAQCCLTALPSLSFLGSGFPTPHSQNGQQAQELDAGPGSSAGSKGRQITHRPQLWKLTSPRSPKSLASAGPPAAPHLQPPACLAEPGACKGCVSGSATELLAVTLHLAGGRCCSTPVSLGTKKSSIKKECPADQASGACPWPPHSDLSQHRPLLHSFFDKMPSLGPPNSVPSTMKCQMTGTAPPAQRRKLGGPFSLVDMEDPCLCGGTQHAHYGPSSGGMLQP